MWFSLILFSSCCLSSSPDATECRSAICSSFPGSLSTSPAHLFVRAHVLSFNRSVSATLSLYAFIVASPVKVFSIIVVIRSRHPLLCGFIDFPCDVSAEQPFLITSRMTACLKEFQIQSLARGEGRGSVEEEELPFATASHTSLPSS